ncbi:MAG: MFS transporter [Simkaniaceae bacterium]|nr:MFS transporter [Simkaniaceae bacterium]
MPINLSEITTRSWLVLIAMTTCLSVILFDSTVIPVALPTIQKDLGVSPVNVHWIMNSYLLTYAALVIATSKLANRIGHRTAFCLGMSIFALGSIFGGVGTNGLTIIFGRVTQGFGAALMGPAALSILFATFPPSVRGRVLGISVSISSFFFAAGPFFGGLLTEFSSWRYLFWVNLPIAGYGIALAFMTVKESKRRKEPFNFPGFLCLVLGMFCLVFGLTQAKVWGWNSSYVHYFLLSAGALLGLLLVNSRLTKTPYVNISLFRFPTYFSGIVILFCMQFLVANTIFWPLIFQKAIGLSPFTSGLYVLISTLPLIVISPLGGYLSDRYGPRIPVLTGIGFILTAFFSLTIYCLAVRLDILCFAMFCFGVGTSFVMTPASTAALSNIPEDKRNLATGFYNTLRFTGGAIGVAVLGAIKSQVKIYEFRHVLQSMDIDLNPLKVARAFSKSGFVYEPLNELSDVTISALKSLYVASQLKAFIWMNIVSIAVTLVALFLTLRYLKTSQSSGSLIMPATVSSK